MTARSVLLRLYYFAAFAALGAYVPYFPAWLEARGIVGLRMGAIAATIPAMGVIGPPLFGAISDTVDARRGLLCVVTFGAFATCGVIAVTALLGHPLTYAGLFAIVLFFAFFRAPTTPLADVAALDLADAGGPSYGRSRLWGSVGFLIAAILVGRYLDSTALAPLPVTIAAAYLVGAMAAFAFPNTPAARARPLDGALSTLLRSGTFQVFLGISFLAQAAHAAYDLCYTLHLRDRGFPPHLVGVAWGLAVFIELVLMAVSPRFLRHVRPLRLLALALAGAAVRWLLIVVAYAPAFLLATQVLHGFSFALVWLASIAFVKERAPAHARATAQGLFVASTAAGSVVGMLAWGPLYRALGGGAAFSGAAVVSLTASVVALLLDAHERTAWSARPASLP